MNVVHGKVTGQGGCIVYDLVPATGHVDTVKYNDDQRDGHNNTLDEVSGRHCHKAAHDSISYNNNGAYDHGNVIICSEQAGEQGSDSLKSGRGVRDKENQDDDGRDAHMIPAGESQTNGESQKTGEKKNVQENASDAQDNNINSELPPVSIVPESTAAASSDAADKDTSGTDGTSSENDKTENIKTDPIELPFVPAY